MSGDLVKVAARLVANGKGLLASDESTGTIGKRLEKAGIANTEVEANIVSELDHRQLHVPCCDAYKLLTGTTGRASIDATVV